MSSSSASFAFETFGELLRHLRLRAGLTQREFGQAVGYSDAQITRLENGQRLPDLAIVKALFVEALDLKHEPELAKQLIELAEKSRSEGSKIKREQPTVARSKMNLPAQLTSFVGRERELSEVKELLGATRLLTLIGAGGMGKTRLAQVAGAAVLNTFADGVWYVELASLKDSTLVPQTVAATLKLIEQPGRAPLDAITDYFEAQHSLLILDNCEHLIATCAELAVRLLQHCPQLRILATSRETLRVPGEVVYRVPSLTTPPLAHEASDLSSYESVRLFVERARVAQSTFELTPYNADEVAQVCRRLDGIPLALELAAARMTSLTIKQITKRLDDCFSLLTSGVRTALPRQQTLHATIAWSVDLLSEPERELFAKLSVFVGGFTAEVVETIFKRPNTLELLLNLVDKSLVVADVSDEMVRYHVLEIIRQYAAEMLQVIGDANNMRRKHALAYLALAEAAEPHMHDHEQKHWLDRLERDHDNFRAALQWSKGAESDSALGLRLAVAMWQFWWIRGYFSEGGRWMKELSHTVPSNTPYAIQAWALLSTGLLSMDYQRSRGFQPSSLKQFEDALVLFRHIGDDAGTALSLCEWAVATADVSRQGHDLVHTQRVIQESLEISRRQTSHPWITLRILEHLAFTMHWRGELLQAAEVCEECISIARQTGNAQSLSESLILKADILGSQLCFARAIPLSEEALRVSREVGNTINELDALRQFADGLRFMGLFDEATELIKSMHSLSRDRGLTSSTGVAITMLGLIARDAHDLHRAASLFRESICWYREKLKTWGRWWNVLGLGTVASAQGLYIRAARIFGAAEAWYVSINLMRFPHNQLQFGTYIDTTRAHLGETAYAAAFEQGRAMTPEQAFLYALSHDNEEG